MIVTSGASVDDNFVFMNRFFMWVISGSKRHLRKKMTRTMSEPNPIELEISVHWIFGGF